MEAEHNPLPAVGRPGETTVHYWERRLMKKVLARTREPQRQEVGSFLQFRIETELEGTWHHLL